MEVGKRIVYVLSTFRQKVEIIYNVHGKQEIETLTKRIKDIDIEL